MIPGSARPPFGTRATSVLPSITCSGAASRSASTRRASSTWPSWSSTWTASPVRPALHPARVAADDAVGRLGDADQVKQFVDAGPQRATAHALDAALQHQVLAAGAVAVDAGLLRHVADGAADGVRLADDVPPYH